jgi:hypothetical protein
LLIFLVWNHANGASDKTSGMNLTMFTKEYLTDLLKGYACLSITLTINILLAWAIGACFRKSDCEYYLPILLFDYTATFTLKYAYAMSFNFNDKNFDIKNWIIWGVFSKVVLSALIFVFEA